jgi:hypothetical protein
MACEPILKPLYTVTAGLRRYAPSWPFVNISVVDCPAVFLEEFRAGILESDIWNKLLFAQRLSCERVERTGFQMSKDAYSLVRDT